MITKDNLKLLLLTLEFEQNGNQFSKRFADSDTFLKVDFDKNLLIYPEDQGLTIHERQTCNFSVKEGDFVLSNSMSFGRHYILKISGCIHDGWLLLSNFSEKINKDYLYEVLSYETTQLQFTQSAAGGVVQNLNTGRVKATRIPLPPLEIQTQIVQACETIDAEVIAA
jgi:restriction endonuclease S subunit